MVQFVLVMMVCVLLAAGATVSAAQNDGSRIEVPEITRPHPRLFVTAEQLVQIRTRIDAGEQPWSDAFANVRAVAEAALAPEQDPSPYAGDDPMAFFTAATRDGNRARELALAHALTGDPRYRRRAEQYLLAWAAADPLPGVVFDPQRQYPDQPMLQARGLSPFVYAYDLLLADDAMPAADRQAVEKWFREVSRGIADGPPRWARNNYFNRQYHNNHLAAHMMGMVIIGYVLGEREMVQSAIDHPDNPRDFRAQLAGLILMPDDEPHHREPDVAPPPQAGEVYDRYRHFTARYRGLQYAHKSLSLLAMVAEAAHHNGLDLYGHTAPGGERLELAFNYYADFYRLKRANLRSGFYAMDTAGRLPGDEGYDESRDESRRIGRAGDSPGLWEVAHLRYPDNAQFAAVLEEMDRPRQRLETLGFVALTHARKALE
jgi:hypothetical protein